MSPDDRFGRDSGTPKRRMLPAVTDVVRDLARTVSADPAVLFKAARAVVADELGRVKQGFESAPLDVLVKRARRQLEAEGVATPVPAADEPKPVTISAPAFKPREKPEKKPVAEGPFASAGAADLEWEKDLPIQADDAPFRSAILPLPKSRAAKEIFPPEAAPPAAPPPASVPSPPPPSVSRLPVPERVTAPEGLAVERSGSAPAPKPRPETLPLFAPPASPSPSASSPALSSPASSSPILEPLLAPPPPPPPPAREPPAVLSAPALEPPPPEPSFEAPEPVASGADATPFEPAAPAFEPPASPYEPPAPKYEPPAPKYEPPAPKYEPPAPRYQPPAPRVEPGWEAEAPTSQVRPPLPRAGRPASRVAPPPPAYEPPPSPAYPPPSLPYEPPSPAYEPPAPRAERPAASRPEVPPAPGRVGDVTEPVEPEMGEFRFKAPEEGAPPKAAAKSSRTGWLVAIVVVLAVAAGLVWAVRTFLSGGLVKTVEVPSAAPGKQPEAAPASSPAVSAPAATAPAKAAALPGAAPPAAKPAPVPKGKAALLLTPDWSGKPVFVVHFSSSKDRPSAEKEAKRLAAQFGKPGRAVEVDLGEKGVWYRAVIGEFATVEEARAFRADLEAKKTPGLGFVYEMRGR